MWFMWISGSDWGNFAYASSRRLLVFCWSNSFTQHFVLISLLVEQLILALLGPFLILVEQLVLASLGPFSDLEQPW